MLYNIFDITSMYIAFIYFSIMKFLANFGG